MGSQKKGRIEACTCTWEASKEKSQKRGAVRLKGQEGPVWENMPIRVEGEKISKKNNGGIEIRENI